MNRPYKRVRRDSGASRIAIVGLILLTAVLGHATLAQAKPARATLVLGVQQGGRVQEAARRAIMAQLEQQGDALVRPRHSLTNAELACDKLECLLALGRRESAAALLGGTIVQSGRSYEIKLWLFDVKAEQTQEKVVSCQDCGEVQLQDAIAQAAGELIATAEVTCPKPEPCPPCLSPAALPVAPALAPAMGMPRSQVRLITGLLWGETALVTIGAAVFTGLSVSGPSDRCRLDVTGTNRTIIAESGAPCFGAAAGALWGSVGISLVLAIPITRILKKAEVRP